MPGVFADLQADPNAYDRAGASAPVSDSAAMGRVVVETSRQIGARGLGALRAFGLDHPGAGAGVSIGEGGPVDLSEFERPSAAPKLTADEANDKFGIDGHLSFSGPVGRGEAAFKQYEAQRRVYLDDVMSRADLNPLQLIGASIGGALLDPGGLPLMFAPEIMGLRGAVEGGLAGRGAYAAGEAVVRSGRVGNIGRGALAGGIEGVAGGAVYEVPNYGLARYSGDDDYTLGDSLANVLLGGVLGVGLGGFAGALTPTRARLPRAVEALDADARLGAAVTALDDVIEDRPVTVADAIEAQHARADPTRPGPARKVAADVEPETAVLDLRGPGPEGTRPEPIDLRPPSERAADPGGPGPEPAQVAVAEAGAQSAPSTASRSPSPAAQGRTDPIASDPALKALHDDTEALAAAAGVELPAPLPNADPATLAEGIRAAAICLAVELGE